MKEALKTLILISVLIFPLIIFAVPPDEPGVGVPPSQPRPETDAKAGTNANAKKLLGIIERIGDWMFRFLMAAAVIALIIAAFYFVTAGGDPAKIAQARNMILYTLIGVAVAVLAKGAVKIVESIVK